MQLFQEYLWLLHVIYVMILMGNRYSSIHSYFRAAIILVFILDISMMLAIDCHVLVWQWPMDNL